MHGKFLHPSAGGRNREPEPSYALVPVPVTEEIRETDLHVAIALAAADRACCCSAKPVIVALIPSTTSPADSIDLLLCGHHYRASRDALRAAGATVYDSREAPAAVAECSPDVLWAS